MCVIDHFINLDARFDTGRCWVRWHKDQQPWYSPTTIILYTQHHSHNISNKITLDYYINKQDTGLLRNERPFWSIIACLSHLLHPNEAAREQPCAQVVIRSPEIRRWCITVGNEFSFVVRRFASPGTAFSISNRFKRRLLKIYVGLFVYADVSGSSRTRSPIRINNTMRPRIYRILASTNKRHPADGRGCESGAMKTGEEESVAFQPSVRSNKNAIRDATVCAIHRAATV